MDKVNDLLKPSDATPVVVTPPPIPFNIRVAIGLLGILFASMRICLIFANILIICNHKAKRNQ